MAPPAGPLTSNVHRPVRIPCHSGQRLKPDREFRFRNRRQPPLQGVNAQLVVTGPPAEDNDILVAPVADRLCILLPFIANPESLIDRGQLDDIG